MSAPNPQFLYIFAFVLCTLAAAAATLESRTGRMVTLSLCIGASFFSLPAFEITVKDKGLYLLPAVLSLCLYYLISGFRSSYEERLEKLSQSIREVDQQTREQNEQIQILLKKNRALLRLNSRQIPEHDLSGALEHLLNTQNRETFLNELARFCSMATQAPCAACFQLEDQKLVRTGGIGSDLPSIIMPDDPKAQQAMLTHQTVLLDAARKDAWQLVCGINEEAPTQVVVALGGLEFEQVEASRGELLRILCLLGGRLIPPPLTEDPPPEA